MDIKIIQEQLKTYKSKTYEEEENALKEITQEIALLALSRVNFFKIAEFHGGTALRILYGLQRFSEDLDFALLKPNRNFDFNFFLEKMKDEFNSFGYQIEIKNRSRVNETVKKAFLKDNSIGKLLSLTYRPHKKNTRKINIKIEIDINPPEGANIELKYLDFPLPFSILAKDMPSSFACKTHALLCREYIKGRDWYDFLWYIARKTSINFKLLENAIYQIGPWSEQKIKTDKNWIITHLHKKITSIDWEIARHDVSRFIKPIEKKSLELWSTEFFLDRLQQLSENL